MDDKPKAQVGPPLFYADYGVDWARPGSDRTVWMTATEVETRQEMRYAGIAQAVREAQEKCREDMWETLARYILPASYAPPVEPEPTETEAALHRAVLATRRDGE